MEGEKALLKLKERLYYLDQYICFTVMEADAGIFYISPFEGKVSLIPGVDIDKDLLKSVRSEKGLPVEIEACNALDEQIDLFLSEEEEDGEETGKRKMMMLFQPFFGSGKYSLEMIDEQGKTVLVFPKFIVEGLDSALETLRDCEGISSVEFSGCQFIIEIDGRASWIKIFQDVENWLGSCFGVKMTILILEDYLKKFSRCPSQLQCPPNQRKLDFP